MKVEVRLAVLSDLSRIVEISNAFEPKEHYEEAFKLQIHGNYKTGAISFLFTVLVDNIVQGHGKLLDYKSIDHPDTKFESPDGWYLNGAIIDQDFRRMGLAKSLFFARKNFSQRKKSSLYSIVATDNTASISYHKSVGMKEFSRAEGYLNVQLNCGEGILFKA
jgi:ribosomal protein S18 acetylase RimI-like enzyme